MRSFEQKQVSVTNALIGACVLVYALQFLIPPLTERLLFYPPLGLVEPWRFVSAAFTHGGLIHLALNLLFLYVLGKAAQPFFTQLQILLIYLLCAWGGSLGTLLWGRLTGDLVPTVGASGAVLGFCAALFVFSRHLSDLSASLGGLLVVNLLVGFVLPNVAWHAHLGGALVGLLAGASLRAVAIKSGRAGRKHLQAQIPDVVDQKRARDAVERVRRVGGLTTFIGLTLGLAAVTYAGYFI